MGEHGREADQTRLAIDLRRLDGGDLVRPSALRTISSPLASGA